MMELTFPNIDTLVSKLTVARWETEFWLVQQRCNLAKAQLQWHARHIVKCRATINVCAEREVELHGGIPADMIDPVADALAERNNIARIIEEGTR